MITVECRGEQCPIPVVKTIKAIGEMKEADTVQTHVDNETAVQNLTKLAESKGVEVPGEENAVGVYETAMAQGLGKEDFSATYKLWDEEE